MAKHSELSDQIERLVREYLGSARREVQDAIQRGLGDTKVVGRSVAPAKRTGTAGARRTEGQMAELAETLYAAVCAHPGEPVTVLAAQIGESAKQLHRPMSRLRRDGRVRSVGERSATRYFPTTK